MNDADFVLPEALVQWRAPATRRASFPNHSTRSGASRRCCPPGARGPLTLRERACWRGNGAPAGARTKWTSMRRSLQTRGELVREWAEKRHRRALKVMWRYC